MHELVLLINLLCVCLRGESCQTFLINVDSKRLITGDHYIDSQVKFVTIDQQWVGNVFGDNTCFIDIDIVDIIDDINAASLTSIGWFHDPHIFLAFMLLQFLVVIIKVAKLVGQDVCVRAEVKGRFAEALLQTHDIEAQAIFAGDFVRLGEMINFLVLI